MCDVVVCCLNNSLHKSILVGIIYPLTDLLEFDADHGSSVSRYNTDFVRFSAGGSGCVPGAGVRHRRRGRLRMFRDSMLDRRDFSSVQYYGSVSL